jgi:hypothetical protein
MLKKEISFYQASSLRNVQLSGIVGELWCNFVCKRNTGRDLYE